MVPQKRFMIRTAMAPALAALAVVLSGAGPAAACSTSASSTFCADGWVARPMGARRVPAAEDPAAPYDDPGGTGFEAGSSEEDLYVEGAVILDEPPSGPDEDL